MKNEIWKTIQGYENYEVSNFGNVKSKHRYYKCGKSIMICKEKILKPYIIRGYYSVMLLKKRFPIHKLVAMSFLNHVPCGHKEVVNHKDFNRLNNNLNNLEIVTQRENSNLLHIPHSSKYTGVSWNKNAKKWTSHIRVNNIKIHLGYFINEIDAHNAYQNYLINFLNK
jgi:hypothetical protein